MAEGGGKSKDLQAMELFESSLDLPSSDRANFISSAEDADSEIRDAALRLLSQHHRASNALRTGGAEGLFNEADDELPERIGAYRILSLIGRGGMGAVYLGERDSGDFDHRVAIKLIRPGILSDSLVERFTRERQLLAQLNHPHIARLYDGGETASGLPYIVMEHVEGMSLGQWTAEASPTLDQRLDLMEQVCDAVAFAHRNLIIHRDLTPGNILVADDGQAKLIDFGIARPQAESDEPQQQSAITNLSLTPGYAAPERTTGGAVTTLSDIYSLGRIFETLLSDDAPDELKAIAAKAAADDPEERYASAEAMQRDIANFRTGFPVQGFSQSEGYRLRKFVSRHKLAVGAAAIAVIALLAGVLLLTNAWRETERERIAAETRFDQVRALSNFLLFDLYDELEDRPGNTKALNDIADRARRYLDNLSKIEGASPELQLEAALAYKRLADVMGNPIGSNLGRSEEAGELLDKALSRLKSLHGEYPDNRAITKGYAETLYSGAVYQFITVDDNERAYEMSNRSAELYWQLANSGDPDGKLALAAIDAEVEAGTALGWTDRSAEAVQILLDAEEKFDAFVKSHPTNETVESMRGRLLMAIAETMSRHIARTEKGEYADALAYAQRAIESREKLVEIAAKKEGARKSLMKALFKRAILFGDLQRDEEALADLERAEAIARNIIAADPRDHETQRNLASFLEQKAITLAYAGRPQEAKKTANDSIRRKQSAVAKQPKNTGLKRELASSLLLAGEVYEIAEDRTGACTRYRKAETLYGEIERSKGLSEYDREFVMKGLPESIAKVCS